MDTPLSVEFFEDDEDNKYIELEGKVEVQFSLSEMDEAMEEAKRESKDDMLLSLGGVAMEVTMAYLGELYPAIHGALAEHYNLPLDDEEIHQAQEELIEALPGFMADLDGGELEDC